jgi:hypothetical protein
MPTRSDRASAAKRKKVSAWRQDLGTVRSKLQPKLQMFANGDTEVQIRALIV